MRVSVVGARISGLSAAFELCNGGAEVVVYEKKVYLSGHLRTVAIDGIDLDLGFMVFNRKKRIVIFPIENQKEIETESSEPIEDHESEIEMDSVEDDGAGMATEIIFFLIHHHLCSAIAELESHRETRNPRSHYGNPHFDSPLSLPSLSHSQFNRIE